MANRLVECIDHSIVHNTAILVCFCKILATKKSVPQLLDQILKTAKLWRKLRSYVLKPNHVTTFRVGNLPVILSIPILRMLDLGDPQALLGTQEE